MMRTFLVTFIPAAVISSPAAAASRNFGITSFEKIRVDGPYKVRLRTGVAPFATATGSPAAIDRVAIEVRGNTLIVHTNPDSWGGYPGQASGPVEISLGTHDLNAGWLNGSGALAIDQVKGLSFDLEVQGSGAAAIGHANVDQLKIAIAGTGSAILAGQARQMTAVVRGIASLDASKLSVKDATIGVEGTASIAADVANSASIDGSGPVTVRLTGGPACRLRVSGSASVTGCKTRQ